jgi:hypothetical protein
MKMLPKKPTPRRKFIWFQIAALVLGFVLPLVLPTAASLFWSPILGLAGVAWSNAAFVERARNGIDALRFAVAGALAFLASLIFWKSLLAVAIMAFQQEVLEMGYLVHFAGPEYAGLPLFTTGCLAYFELGPFRSRTS